MLIECDEFTSAQMSSSDRSFAACDYMLCPVEAEMSNRLWAVAVVRQGRDAFLESHFRRPNRPEFHSWAAEARRRELGNQSAGCSK
jgi:hypothetical protein